ncbi:Putative serine/threonine-protein kinase/receptor R818 [Rhizoctonia solani]|uniref:Putative serine/threonine-protein kinase/receptor R818 n=1 Tax=Rhizoctonia solani TaxID=456999 RepID=A0A0K6FRB5_9AGAM|nr:Putative serine/threonine-protein kinase/receptor R818 [Rhizoctonia solani]
MWKYIVELEEQSEENIIGWVIEIDELFVDSPEMTRYLESVSKEGLVAFSSQLGCALYAISSKLTPLSHSVLGQIHCDIDGLSNAEVLGGVPSDLEGNYAEALNVELIYGLESVLPERPEKYIPTNSRDGDDLWKLLSQCCSAKPSGRPITDWVVEIMQVITQDGLQDRYAPQESGNDPCFEPRGNAFKKESLELSDVESVSSSSSDTNFRHSALNGLAIDDTSIAYQGLLGTESRIMARKILKQLATHGCENLTDHMNQGSFSVLPLFRGGFGDVYRGNLLGGLKVAIKIPQVSLNILEENPNYLKDVAREIHTWSKCDHPNVLHFLGLAEFRGQIGMVAPWMESGSLPRYLKKAFGADRCKLCAQICEGVAYLHEIGIVHGDLKGENVLISADGVAVISDFGGSLLRNRSLNIIPLEKGSCLTYRWAAPELLLQGEMNEIDESNSMTGTQLKRDPAPPIRDSPARDIFRQLVEYSAKVPNAPTPLGVQWNRRNNLIISFPAGTTRTTIKLLYPSIYSLVCPEDKPHIRFDVPWSKIHLAGILARDRLDLPITSEEELRHTLLLNPALQALNLTVQPTWLKKPENITGTHTSAIIAFEDPDGSIKRTLLKSAIFAFEQYVLCYTKASVMALETLEEDIMSSAQECMQTITAISEEEDQVKSDLLASKVSREMLHSLLLLSLSGHGVIYLAQPSLVRGCIKLMKTIKVDNVISPFSYEYGYLCFNIAKMALGVCLVEKFNSQNITELMERIRSNYKTKDNPSILTELLWELFVQETATPSKGDSRCDWIFGWSDPPVDSGRWHPKLIVTESDALDLLHILCNDRKLFLKSLLAAYTPGASILTLLIWQRMLRNGLQFDLAGRIPLLEPFLDLCWRFSLVATPCDYGFLLRMGHSAMFHYSKLAASAVDAADSRTIINAYIRGIPIIDDTSFYRETATVVYPQLPRFVMCNILPGTEHLFPALIRTILGRMWEMVLWEDVHHFFSDLDIIISGVDDLL